jgi:hypothetical protein
VFLEVQADVGQLLPGAGGSAFAGEEEEELEELDMEGLANVVHGGRMNAPASSRRLAVDNFLPDSVEEEDEDEDSGSGYMPSMMGDQKRRGAGSSRVGGDSEGYVLSMLRPQAVATGGGQGTTWSMLGWEGLEA